MLYNATSRYVFTILCALHSEDGRWSLYVLDMEKGIWHRQDDSHALAFAELDGEMYMLLANGLLYALNGAAGEEEQGNISWYAETAVMGYETPDHHYISRLLLRMRLGKNTDCALSIQYDSDGVWHGKGTVHGNGQVKTYLLPVLPRRCGHLQLRLEGAGDIQLYGIARVMTAGRE